MKKLKKLLLASGITFSILSVIDINSSLASTITGGMSYSKDGTNFLTNDYTGEYTFEVGLISGPPEPGGIFPIGIKITQQSSNAKKGSESNGWFTLINFTGVDVNGNLTFDRSNIPYYASQEDFENNKVKFRGRFTGSFNNSPKDLDFKFFPSPDSTKFPESFWMFTSPTPQDPEEPESEEFEDFSSQPPFVFVSTPGPTLNLSLLIFSTLGTVSTLKRKLKLSNSSEKETTKR